MPPPGLEPVAPVVVRVSGPGHHDRAGRARPVIAALTAAGFSVRAIAGLRPRLADDVRALIDSGADAVELTAPGLHGVVRADPASGVDPAAPAESVDVPTDVVVELVAGAGAAVTVTGDGARADRVRRVLDDR